MGGDRVRICQTLSFLIDDYDVDVVYVTHDKTAKVLKSENPLINNEYRFYIPKITRYIQAAKTLFNRTPLFVNHYYNRTVQKFINNLILHKHYDRIVCGSIAMAKYLLKHTNAAIYLDMTDSLSMNYKNRISKERILSRVFWRINLARTMRFEKKCVSTFNCTSYISRIDQNFLNTNGKTCIVPNYVHIPQNIPPKNHNSKNIVFVGKMDYEPNIMAATFFAQQVFPIIRQKGDYKFVIVGMNPTETVQKLAQKDVVIVTGKVDSVEPYYQDAAIVVAPMLSGSGIQNKIIEAMAQECCVVTTSFGAEGLEEISDGIVITSTNPQLMSETIISLLENDSRRAMISRKARLLTQQFLSYEKVQKYFRNFIADC